MTSSTCSVSHILRPGSGVGARRARSPGAWAWRGLGIGGFLAACAPNPSPVDAERDARWMLEYYVAARQDAYRSVHGRFAADYSSLHDPHSPPTSAALGRARPDIEIRIVGGDAGGWSATATHREFPGCSCVLTVGTPSAEAGLPRESAPGALRSQAGMVVCRGFGTGES